MRDHPEDNAAFNRGLAEIRKEEQAAIATAYDWTGVTTVVDIGAGAGALVASIVAAHPGVRGILFDRPDVLPDADHLLTGRGVRDRCELVGGSFFESLPVEGDAWILSQVLHDWPDAECRTILSRCGERMNAGDRLLVVEMIPVPGQPDAGLAMLDIAMMIFAGEARQRTREEYDELFASTGFGPARVVETATAFSILEAHPMERCSKRRCMLTQSNLDGGAVRHLRRWSATASRWRHACLNVGLCTLLLIPCAYLHGYDAANEAGQADKAYRQAMNAREVAALEKLLTDDFLFIRRTGEIWDKQAFLGNIKAGKLVAEVQEKHLKTRLYRDTVIVTHMDSLKIGSAAVVEMIATRVFVKQRGAWRLASVQDTALPAR